MKIKVLVLMAHYLPSSLAGGPIRSISNLVEQLGDEFEFSIITLDRDFGASHPLHNIETGSWCSVGKAQVLYLHPGLSLLLKIKDEIKRFDGQVVYLNSFFDWRFSTWPLLIAYFKRILPYEVILAPRGEFSAGALRIKSTKKKIYIFFAKILKLHKKVYWQASTEHEKLDISNSMDGVGRKILVARNLSALQNTSNKDQKYIKKNVLSICYLSRITPKKNLEFALQILSNVRTNIHFTIYGPIEDIDYWKTCQTIIARLPSNVSVHYAGSISAGMVANTIGKHDLLFVPTIGENYGHVFIESWSAGVPVLISDKTPWRNLADQNVGWDLSLDKVEPFIAAIDGMARWLPEKQLQVHEACRSKAYGIIFDDKAITSNRNLFLTVIGKSQS